MKKLRTLRDIDIKTSSTDGVEQSLIISTEAEYWNKLQLIAKEWIRYLEEQKDLHLQWIAKGIGEYPDFDYPEGFDGNAEYSPSDRDAIIYWIKHFFNLDVKDEKKNETN